MVKIPLPVKCTIEERKGRKFAKLHFACQGRSGEHCLYKTTFYTMKTRNPRTWIHLMFLALQVSWAFYYFHEKKSLFSREKKYFFRKIIPSTFLFLFLLWMGWLDHVEYFWHKFCILLWLKLLEWYHKIEPKPQDWKKKIFKVVTLKFF